MSIIDKAVWQSTHKVETICHEDRYFENGHCSKIDGNMTDKIFKNK